MGKEEFLRLIESIDICKITSFTINYEDYEAMSYEKTITFSK